MDEKWEGAPFASMIRGSHSDPGLNEDILRVVFVLQSTNSKVKQVKYSSIVLQVHIKLLFKLFCTLAFRSSMCMIHITVISQILTSNCQNYLRPCIFEYVL